MDALDDLIERTKRRSVCGNDALLALDLLDNAMKCDDALLLSGEGVMFRPMIEEGFLVNLFPYCFYAQKLDEKEGVLEVPAEGSLSVWYKELAEISYVPIDPLDPSISKEALCRYLKNIIDRFGDSVYLQLVAF